MVVSLNPNPERHQFESLLESTVNELNNHAKKTGHTLADLTGQKLEPYAAKIMSELAFGTPFEGTIEEIGGQKFPDVIANKYYGVEIKTTTQNHWRSTGNSVLESTRVENVERIFMLFAKLAAPIEFRSRPYEEVLSEVVVTHSPRYLIDMNLGEGMTIFDKINMPYDTLRKLDNPIRPIVDYYKGLLKPGEELWWMDADSSNKSSNIIIRIWSHLTISERTVLKNKAMAFFPELFGNSPEKFGRLAIWLVTSEAIVCSNVRDLFSAGGKDSYAIGGRTYQKVPRIFKNLLDNLGAIISIIKSTPAIELSEFWETPTTDENKLNDWLELVSENASKIKDAQHLDIRQMIRDSISYK